MSMLYKHPLINDHPANATNDRITVLLAASAAGEKLRPLVTGKSKKPRCFYGFEIPTLGVDYDYSKKSWMTTGIFTT